MNNQSSGQANPSQNQGWRIPGNVVLAIFVAIILSIGWIYLALGMSTSAVINAGLNPDLAIWQARAALLVDPENYFHHRLPLHEYCTRTALIGEARAHRKKQDLPSAIKSYSAIIDLDPSDSLAIGERRDTYNELGDKQAADRDSQTMTKSGPPRPLKIFDI